MNRQIELTPIEANTIATALNLYLLQTQQAWTRERAARYIEIVAQLRELGKTSITRRALL